MNARSGLLVVLVLLVALWWRQNLTEPEITAPAFTETATAETEPLDFDALLEQALGADADVRLLAAYHSLQMLPWELEQVGISLTIDSIPPRAAALDPRAVKAGFKLLPDGLLTNGTDTIEYWYTLIVEGTDGRTKNHLFGVENYVATVVENDTDGFGVFSNEGKTSVQEYAAGYLLVAFEGEHTKYYPPNAGGR